MGTKRDKSLDPFVSMSAKAVEDLIVRMWDVFVTTGRRYVIYIEGPPGGGKTSIYHAAAARIAEAMGRIVSDTPTPGDDEFGKRVVHLGNIGEEVMAGLPWVNKAESSLHRAMDIMWPTQGTGLMLLDEPFQMGYAQRFVSQLASEGKFGDYYSIPDGWLFVLCGNAQNNRAGTQRIWTHVQNRIIHVRLENDVDTVLRNFADPATPEMSVYLRWFPDRLHQFRTTGEPFTSPRSLDYGNTMLSQGFDPVDDYAVFQGLWGTEVALDFKTTFTALSGMPNIDSMLADPAAYADEIRSRGANNPASICALAAVLVRKWMTERDERVAERSLTLMSHSSAEHATAFVAVCESVDEQVNDGRSILDLPAYARYVSKYSQYIAN